MVNHWLKEVYRVALFISVFALLGWLLNDLLAFFLVGASLYIIWTLYQLKRIHHWLQSDIENNHPPEGLGIWGAICDRLYSLQKEQRFVQDQLSAEVQYLRGSFTSLSDAVVMTTPDGLISWCNLSAQRFLGLRLPDDEGISILNLLRDPGFIDLFEGDIQQQETLIMQAPVDYERVLAVEVTTFGEGNRIIFARDITEVSKLEKMRQDFVSNVSHELRTPLTVISGYIDNFSMMSEQLPALKKPLKQMRQHTMRMEDLIRDLLTLSRLETLPDEMHDTSVDLSALAEQVIDEARASLPENQQRTFELRIDPNVKVYGSGNELHSALLNLVVNACRYTHDKGYIEIDCLANEQGAQFSVTDDGIGIDPLHIPRLTERFFRTDRSRNVNTGGTGLGLSIVKHILQHHESELLISSKMGKGSCFTCQFPEHRVVRQQQAS